VLYPLAELLLLALAATIAGANDFVEITLWGGQHLGFLRRFLAYENGIPGQDTMGATALPCLAALTRHDQRKPRQLRRGEFG
jgi:hypothetical protein